MYEVGAILGRARKDKLDVLQQMLYIPQVDKPVFLNIKPFQILAKHRLDGYVKRFGREPNTFDEFIFLWGLQIATGKNLIDSLRAMYGGNKKALKAFEKRVKLEKISASGYAMYPVKKTETEIRAAMVEGIGFGSLFPELTYKMNNNYWQSFRIDMDEWSKLREDNPGWLISPVPEKPIILSFDEIEALILNIVSGYTSACYPELLESLDLKKVDDNYILYTDWVKTYIYTLDDIYFGLGDLVRKRKNFTGGGRDRV